MGKSFWWCLLRFGLTVWLELAEYTYGVPNSDPTMHDVSFDPDLDQLDIRSLQGFPTDDVILGLAAAKLGLAIAQA